MYQKVLEIELPYLSDVTRASKPQRLPAVFTPQEAMQVIANLPSEYTLIAELMYGAGLRLMESVRLRIKDIRTTQLYTHVMNKGANAVKSPLDTSSSA